MKNQIIVKILVSVLLLFHFLSGLNVINRLSPTYDEPLHLAAGYSYWRTGSYYLNIYDHPPLAEKIAALPLIFLRPVLPLHLSSWSNYEQYSFADSFLYKNKIDAEKMLNSGRVMILLLSCILGYFVFKWTDKLFGATTGLLILLLYVLFPGFIAHATLVTTDIALTLFFFTTFYFFYLWNKNKKWHYAALCGASAGAALCSKFSAIIIFPLILLIFILLKIKMFRQGDYKFPILVFTGIFFVFLFIVMFFIYGFNSLELYVDGLKTMARSMDRGRSSFLSGNYSTTGWRHYFIIVFLIKTPVPFILLIISSLLLIRKNTNTFNSLPVLLVPALLYFTAASFSKVQIGFRHILPVYPFLFVISGIAIKLLIEKYSGKLVLLLLFLWNIYSTVSIHPWHISYFNEFTGGSSNGYKFLTDSNVDWGQGLKELSKKYKTLFMCYFGTGDPHYYGIKYLPVGFVSNLKPQERQGDLIKPAKGEKVLFAVSATNLQATYFADKKIFFFLSSIKPEIVAYSILVYDLTDKNRALSRLAQIYALDGRKVVFNSIKVL